MHGPYDHEALGSENHGAGVVDGLPLLHEGQDFSNLETVIVVSSSRWLDKDEQVRRHNGREVLLCFAAFVDLLTSMARKSFTKITDLSFR